MRNWRKIKDLNHSITTLFIPVVHSLSTKDLRWECRQQSLLNLLVTPLKLWSVTIRISVSSNWNLSWCRFVVSNLVRWISRPSTWTNPCLCLRSWLILSSMRSNPQGTATALPRSPVDIALIRIHRPALLPAYAPGHQCRTSAYPFPESPFDSSTP